MRLIKMILDLSYANRAVRYGMPVAYMVCAHYIPRQIIGTPHDGHPCYWLVVGDYRPSQWTFTT